MIEEGQNLLNKVVATNQLEIAIEIAQVVENLKVTLVILLADPKSNIIKKKQIDKKRPTLSKSWSFYLYTPAGIKISKSTG